MPDDKVVIPFPGTPETTETPGSEPDMPFVDGPHLEGTAICGACHYEWECVAPSGSTHLDCPKCKRLWGAFKNVVSPEVAWRCQCGEQLFWLTPTGAMCRRCGKRSNDWAN